MGFLVWMLIAFFALAGCFGPAENARLAERIPNASVMSEPISATGESTANSERSRASEPLAAAGKKVRIKTSAEKRDQQRYLDVTAVSSLFGGLTGEGQVAYGGGRQETVEDFDLERYGLMRFGVSGTLGKFSYGTQYRSTGKGFNRLGTISSTQDQEGTEFWMKRSFGVFGFRGSLSQFWNNLEEDRRNPRITKNLGRAAMDIALPALPTLSLSYHHGLSQSSIEPKGTSQTKSGVRGFGGSLYYTNASWEATLSSKYELIEDLLLAGRETNSMNYSLAGSYRPTDSITLAPTLSLQEEKQTWSGMRTETPSASLSISYRPLFWFPSLITTGSYTATKSSDGFMDTSNLSATAGISLNLSPLRSIRKTVSFEVGYSRYHDELVKENSIDDVTARFLLKIPAF